MSVQRYSEFTLPALVDAANDNRLGIRRALAIEELALRAIRDEDLLPVACAAISSDRAIGLHAGAPLGWLGADAIYRSNSKVALQALLSHMQGWSPTEQEDLVRHWAGKGRLNELTHRLTEAHGWTPGYPVLNDVRADDGLALNS